MDGSTDWVPENANINSEAEKIYATLRECRDQIGLKKMRGIKHQGYLHRKSDKVTKKWKLLYFVLLVDGTDTHLYLYENPKRTKPKGLIDLSCAYLYQVSFIFFPRNLSLFYFISRCMIHCGNVHIACKSSNALYPVWRL